MKTQFLRPGLLLAASLGCLAPRLKADFEADLRRWIGHPITEFSLYKGAPLESKSRPESGKIYVFVANEGRYPAKDPVRFASPDGSLGHVSMRMGGSPQYCRLILETNAEGIILTTRWEGNDCW
jgi:hypothetical protein